jgi:hypothetical protein
MRMPTTLRESSAARRARDYLARLFDRYVTERVELRVENRMAARLEATVDVLSDPALMADLDRAKEQADEDARAYSEIRRDLGIA